MRLDNVPLFRLIQYINIVIATWGTSIELYKTSKKDFLNSNEYYATIPTSRSDT